MVRASYHIGLNKCEGCRKEYIIEYDESWNYSLCISCRDKKERERIKKDKARIFEATRELMRKAKEEE